MANQQQLDLLKQGVAATWNTWKAEHPDTVIELNGVDLSEANLGEVNISEADLSRANLREASDADRRTCSESFSRTSRILTFLVWFEA